MNRIPLPWLSIGVHALLIAACTGVAEEANLLVNGGFERVGRMTPARLERAREHGATFEGDDPLLPMRWTLDPRNAQVSISSDAHGGTNSLRVAGPNGHVHAEIGVIEVVPGATYTFGAWAKGSGSGRLTVHGHAYEGRRALASVDLTLTDTWSESAATVVIPGTVRTVTLALGLSRCEEVWVDDVRFTAPASLPFDPEDALSRKFEIDEHTLLRVDFDGPENYQLENGARLTDEQGGRFGRGLRIEKEAFTSAMIPLDLEAMPTQGTLEFWISPDDEPPHIYHFLSVVAGRQDLLVLQADTSQSLRFRWRTEPGVRGQQNSIRAHAGISRGWFREGQWMHVAFQWDEEAVRYYLNGVLVSISTERPGPFLNVPSGIKLGSFPSVYRWSGVVDEVRLSSIQRYGPLVPSDTTWTPLVAKSPEVKTDAVGAPRVEAPPPDLVQGRLTLLGDIPPPPEGAIAFDAGRMQPLLKGDPTFELTTNAYGLGWSVAQIGDPRLSLCGDDVDGGFWKVEGITAGDYTIGVWYESGTAGAETAVGWRGALYVYLNGRVVQLSTQSDPVQIAPGVYFAEAQARDPVRIQPGDEVGVLSGRNRRRGVARLTLHPGEPPRGRGWMGELFQSGWFGRQGNFGISLQVSFAAAPEKRLSNVFGHRVQEIELPEDLLHTPDGGHAVAHGRIGNPFPVPLTISYEAVIRAYGREIVGTDRTTLTLQPHEVMTREIAFTVIPDSHRYTIDASAKVLQPPSFASLGWPTEEPLTLLPGLRQHLPWIRPFTARDRRALRFTGALPGDRMTFSLNGVWRSAFTTALEPPMPPPEDLAWTARRVPFEGHTCMLAHIEPRPHGLYLQRTFTIPEGMAQNTWRLSLSSAVNEATLYVNGQQAGNVRGTATPLVCDVSPYVVAGTNELVMVLRDIHAIMNPAYVNPAAPRGTRQYLDAPGGWPYLSAGDVTLESSPVIAADGLLITPSVRRKDLTASFTVTSHASVSRAVEVTATVLDAGLPVLDMGRESLTLAPGETKELRMEKPWANPELWGPDSAKLYILAVETTEAASGERIDRLRGRFGFRETWVENGRIYFNGAPIRMKGTTVHGAGGLDRDDIQWSRGTSIPHFMDEFGYLVNRTLAGIFNSSSRHNVERDVFWETAERNVLAGAAFYGNHPSIISWDLSNEWLSFLDYGGGDPMAGARRFKTLADALLGFDASRWIIFNGDYDLHGLHDTFSAHYLSPNGHPIHGFGFRGHSTYFPDGAFFRPLDHDFVEGEEVSLSYHRRMMFRLGSKPLMNTENMWKVGAFQTPGLSKFIGEENVLSPAFDSARGPVAWMWKQNNDGQRDLGVTAICNYSTITGVSRGGHMLQCFILPDQTHHFYGGQVLDRRYSLHNDLFTPSSFVFRWSLVDDRGKVIHTGEDPRRMDSGDLQRGRFSLNLPTVRERTRYVLKLELLADGLFAYGEDRDIEIWPDAAVPAGDQVRTLYLFDPPGATAAAFTRNGIAFEPVPELSAPPGEASASALVIGEDALTPASQASGVPSLHSFVAAGGRLLVLAQTNLLAGLPVRTELETREWSSMPFVRTPQHPVFTGVPQTSGPHATPDPRPPTLSSWDLQFWSPDHVSARGAYTKPEGGAGVPLVDSGTNTGLEWVQMLECYRGRGLYLLSQFPVIGKDGTEPMARELAARLVRYIASAEPFGAPVETLKVVARPGSAALEKLSSLGVDHRVLQLDSAWPEGATVLVDATGLPERFEAPEAWLEALAQGTTLLVHGPVPAQSNLLTRLAGRPVVLTAQPYGMWEGRGYRNGFTRLTAGLSQIDLYWKEYDGAEGGSLQAEDPKHKIEDLCWWSVAADGMTEHVFPGALVELPVGRGRLILDTMRWHTENPRLEPATQRVASALMLGLGIAIEPYVMPRSLPKDIVYQPVRLEPYANRGFIDEVGDDGKGGWTDQGPKLDLREFPTGRQRFGGVPFQIGAEPRGCIVLRSNARPFPELQPEEVTIPIGHPVEGLWFLHAVAYARKGESGRYQIQYDDGSAHEIVLESGENLRDWAAPPGPFRREKGTQSRVAWTGSTEIFPVVSVYQMLWVNPRPEVTVRAVRFSNPTRIACPVLVGLTTVVRGQQAPVDDQEILRARAAMEAGLAAFRAGQDAEARTLLSEAVTLDASMDAAHQALGQVCERLQDEEATLAAYRAWAQAGARTPLPFNKIAEILEHRKEYRGALEAYTRSLEIEWNQPPAIEARSRLQKMAAP